MLASSRDLRHLLATILFLWDFAGLGEEVGYRGYLLRLALKFSGPTRPGLVVAWLIGAIAFDYGHFHEGPAGILESTGSGLVLGGAYLLSRRLWVGSLAHGLNDTVFIAFSYLGW